ESNMDIMEYKSEFIFKSLKEVQCLISEVERTTHTKYVCPKIYKSFSDKDWQPSEKIKISFQKKHIPFTGIPFTLIGSRTLECHLGKDKHKSDKKKYAEHKMEFQVDKDVKWKKSRASDLIKAALSKKEKVTWENQYYVRVPRLEEHIGHPPIREDFWTEFFSLYREHPACWKAKSDCKNDLKIKHQGYDVLVAKLRELDEFKYATRKTAVAKIIEFRKKLQKDPSSSLSSLCNRLSKPKKRQMQDIDSKPAKEYDSDLDLAKDWCNTLKQLEADQRMIAEIAIQKILHEAKMGNLTRPTVKIYENPLKISIIKKKAKKEQIPKKVQDPQLGQVSQNVEIPQIVQVPPKLQVPEKRLHQTNNLNMGSMPMNDDSRNSTNMQMNNGGYGMPVDLAIPRSSNIAINDRGYTFSNMGLNEGGYTVPNLGEFSRHSTNIEVSEQQRMANRFYSMTPYNHFMLDFNN
ncbi:unnamed protein product, partial [Meganyctiphanes norvegica]